jgi:hypothetical protein
LGSHESFKAARGFGASVDPALPSRTEGVFGAVDAETAFWAAKYRTQCLAALRPVCGRIWSYLADGRSESLLMPAECLVSAMCQASERMDPFHFPYAVHRGDA